MKKLYVNKDACIGCGACVAIDPEHFDFGDDNYSEVISNENILSSNAENAISSCPTNAISYVEDESAQEHECENCDSKDCCHKNEDAIDNDELDEAA